MWEGESKIRNFLGWLAGGDKWLIFPISPIFIITFLIFLVATLAYPLLLPGAGFIIAIYSIGRPPIAEGSGIPVIAIAASGILNGVIYGTLAWLILFLGLVFTYKGD